MMLEGHDQGALIKKSDGTVVKAPNDKGLGAGDMVMVFGDLKNPGSQKVHTCQR
jgi:hypothetical protein